MSFFSNINYKGKFFFMAFSIVLVLIACSFEYINFREGNKEPRYTMSIVYSLGVTRSKQFEKNHQGFFLNWKELKELLQDQNIVIKRQYSFTKQKKDLSNIVEIYLYSKSFQDFGEKIRLVKRTIKQLAKKKLNNLNTKLTKVTFPLELSRTQIKELKYSFNIYFILSVLCIHIFLILFFLILKKDIEAYFAKQK